MAYVSPRLASGAASTRTPEDIRKARMDAVMAAAVAKLGTFPDGPPAAPSSPYINSLGQITDVVAHHNWRMALSMGPARPPCSNPVEQQPYLHTPRCRCGFLMGAHKKVST